MPAAVHPGRLLKRELTARQSARARHLRAIGTHHRYLERTPLDRYGGALRPLFRQQPAVLARFADLIRHCRRRARLRRRDRTPRVAGGRGVTAAAADKHFSAVQQCHRNSRNSRNSPLVAFFDRAERHHARVVARIEAGPSSPWRNKIPDIVSLIRAVRSA